MHTLTDTPAPTAAGPAASDRSHPAARGGPAPRGARRVVPGLGVAAFLLTFVALSGVGDAPDPHDPPESMAAHFLLVRDDVLLTAPMGILGAVALGAFVLAVAHRLQDRGERGAASAVKAGGLLAAGYLALLHVVYASLAYEVAASSPQATEGLFVPTILAAPVFGAGVGLALGGAAYGAIRTGLLPRWWAAASALGAAVASVAVFSYADSDAFSPDVQQQVVGGVLQLWVLLTTVTLFRRPFPSRPASFEERQP